MKLDRSPDGVKSWTPHPRFELQPAFEKDGHKYRKIEYVADFDVLYRSGKREVIDVKSEYTMKLPVFRIKQRLFDYKYKDLILVIE